MSEAHNEPAFPIVETDPNMGTRVCPGMSIWDYFFGKAIEGLCVNYDGHSLTPDDMSDISARVADSACAEREKRRQG